MNLIHNHNLVGTRMFLQHVKLQLGSKLIPLKTILEVFDILIKPLKTHVKQPLNYYKIIKLGDLNTKPAHIL